jgi:AcrR family transcriptional regulator
VTATESIVAEEQLLDAAERLFYAKSVQGVGMDELRAESGVPLKRMYQLHPGKEDIVLAVLRRQDVRWRGRLTAHVERVEDPVKRVAALFDWLHEWFAEPGFRGSAWTNAFGELGGTTPAVADEVRAHQDAFRGFVLDLVGEAGGSRSAGRAIFLLAEGAMVAAAVDGSPKPAKHARKAAQALLAGL